MRVIGLLTDKIPLTLDLQADLEGSLNNLLEMFDYSLGYDTIYESWEESLYSGFIKGQGFSNWLYNKSQMADLKRELAIKINRSVSIQEISHPLSDNMYFVGKISVEHVWTSMDYLEFKQHRLRLYASRSLFASELPECFRNINFDSGVPSTLNTLNNEFVSIRDEIIKHLKGLDNAFESIKPLRGRGLSFRQYSEVFTEISGIECSPQASRARIASLKRRYLNEATGEYEELTCELHTKFSLFGRDANRQDRIYFHPGKDGIHNGKIIVIHIGTHL